MRQCPVQRRTVALVALLLALMVPAEAMAQATQRPQQPAGGGDTGQAAAGIPVQSPSAVLLEARSGKVLFARGAHERRHPASITKIMTLILAYDALKAGQVQPDAEVVTSPGAAALGGTTAFLEAGEPAAFRDLLKAIAVGSANDAAVVVAEHLAGSHEAFVQQMNEKARALGMRDTQFRNAHGLDDEGHFSTAYDVALMARHAVLQHPEMLRLTRIFLDEMPHVDGRRTELLNRNRLVRFYDWVDGLKTGFTDQAGYSLVATGERNGTRMIAVVLGAARPEDRQADALRLLEHGIARYVTVPLAKAGAEMRRVPVVLGQHWEVPAVAAGVFAATVPRGREKQVQVEVQWARQVRAPVAKDQRLGTAVARLDGEEVARVDLVAAAAVPRRSLWRSLWVGMGAVLSLGR